MMWIFRKLFRKYRKTQSNKELIIKDTILRLNNLRKRKHTEKLDRLLFSVIRDFFTEYFKIDYEFTYEELKDELENKKIKADIRIKLIELSRILSEMEFSMNKPSKKEIDNLVIRCHETISLL